MIDSSNCLGRLLFILACVVIALGVVFVMATRPELVGGGVLLLMGLIKHGLQIVAGWF